MFTRKTVILHNRIGYALTFLFLIYFIYLYLSMRKYWILWRMNPNCSCFAWSSREVFDLCYYLPETRNHGKKFSCEHIPTLKKLGLLDKSYVHLGKEPLPAPVFVTAFSENHFREGKRLISSIRKHWPHQTVIVYDLGLQNDSRNSVKTWCNVNLRRFDFNSYPSYVGRLWEFRWKPLIIAETLNEFGSIWYMDSSIVFKKSDLSHIYKLVECRSTANSSYDNVDSSTIRDQREEMVPLESGWNIQRWRKNVEECRKATYLLHGYTGHGIFPATGPYLYDYFPTNFEEIMKPKAKMYAAGLVYAVRTKETVERILKWVTLCALQEDCMAPGHVSPPCEFHEDRFGRYAGCHRFDQSAVNLLLANAYHYDRHYYVSEIVDFFDIVRGNVSREITNEKLICENKA